MEARGSHHSRPQTRYTRRRLNHETHDHYGRHGCPKYFLEDDALGSRYTIVRDRAEDIDDKKYRNWNANHINETLKVIIGGAQFTTHTDLWATEQKGIMPPPDFGRFISKDRFTRVLRYWARGELGIELDLGNDPWGEV
jgi:hypothetical protein